MSGCDCLRTVDESLIAKGLTTRLDPALFLNGRPGRAAVRAFVPDDLQPRAASGRITRRARPLTVIALFCPFCGERYPEVTL